MRLRRGRASPAPGLLVAGLRVLIVEPRQESVVVDGIVDRGTALGTPGTPVTLRLVRAQSNFLDLAVTTVLQKWAATGEVVDVGLRSDEHGRTVDLRDRRSRIRADVVSVV